MSYVYIKLFNSGSHAELNPDKAIIRLQEQFPAAVVLPGDQLAVSAHRAEQHLDQSNPANQAVMKKLWWDVRHAGPAYAFYIPTETGLRIEGVIKRYQADFHSEVAFPAALHSRIVGFLRSLIPEGMAVDVCEDRGEEMEATCH